MTVDYKITTASSEDCLTVPSSAIVNTEEGTAVFAKPLTDENGNEIPFDETIPIPEGTEGIPDGFQLVPVEIGMPTRPTPKSCGALTREQRYSLRDRPISTPIWIPWAWDNRRQ